MIYLMQFDTCVSLARVRKKGNLGITSSFKRKWSWIKQSG